MELDRKSAASLRIIIWNLSKRANAPKSYLGSFARGYNHEVRTWQEDLATPPAHFTWLSPGVRRRRPWHVLRWRKPQRMVSICPLVILSSWVIFTWIPRKSPKTSQIMNILNMNCPYAKRFNVWIPIFCSTLEMTWFFNVPESPPKFLHCPPLFERFFPQKFCSKSWQKNLQFRQESECFPFDPWLDRDTFAPRAASLPLHKTYASYSHGSVRCLGWCEGGAIGHRVTELLCFGFGAIPCRSLGIDLDDFRLF